MDFKCYNQIVLEFLTRILLTKRIQKNNISESFAKLMNFQIEMKILPSLYCERLKSNIYQSLGDSVILNRRVHWHHLEADYL